MKNGVIFYEEQIDICRKYFTAEQFGRLMMALFAVDAGEEPEVDDDIRIAYEFLALQRRIDREKYEAKCAKNRENGKLGGRPKKVDSEEEKNPEKPNGFFQNPNKNKNNTEPASLSLASSLSSSLVSYLNKKTGSSYSPTDDDETRISKLLGAGYSEEDMIRVIDRKVEEWGGSDKMRAYLRPRTLFGPKFEEYADAPETTEVEKKRTDSKKVEELRAKLTDASEEVRRLDDQIEEIRGRPGGVNESYEEWQELLDSKAVREQAVENLQKQIRRITG